MMRVYMICDYEEDGPEHIRVSATADGIRRVFKARLDEDWPEGPTTADRYREEVTATFERLVSADQPCSQDLGRGWGGLQLHILDTVG